MSTLQKLTSKSMNLIKLVPKLKQSFRQNSTQADDCKMTKGLVLGLYEKEKPSEAPKLTTVGEKFNETTNGKLMDLINKFDMNGFLGQEKTFTNFESEFRSISVVGLGKEGIGYNELEAIDEGMENARVAAAIGARKLSNQGCTHLMIDPMEYPEQAAEGSGLAIFKHQEIYEKENKQQKYKLDLYDSNEQDAWTRGIYKADAQNLARRLSETAANKMTPTNFAQSVVDELCPCGITVEVRNMDWIESQNMNSFLSVAKSSCETAIFLECTYCGGEYDEPPILLVGSGITFNSGGLCLKDPHGMSEYRASMAGAASVVATMRAIAAMSLPINVSAVIPLCENMPSGMSFKPGDIITCLNGKSIAVHDTNNADVLIMADIFCYGQTTYKPKLVVDVATISKGVQRGLGGAAAGVFSNSHYMWKELHKAGSITGDRVWRLPLWKHFTKNVTNFSNVDISNRGRGTGSTCLAAAFLKEFCPCVDWIHIDIANVGMKITSPFYPYLEPNYMTGRPTRTLIQFLYQLACPDRQQPPNCS